MVCAELFEQFREPAIVAVSGNEAETAVDFETVRVDNTQFVVCEFVQNGLNGDKGEGSRIVQVAFDAFAAAELHLNVHGLQFQTAAGEGFREDVQRPGTVLPDDEGGGDRVLPCPLRRRGKPNSMQRLPVPVRRA